MTTTTNVPQVKLNIMTKAQYNAATKSPTELYMVTDADPDVIVDTTLDPTSNHAIANSTVTNALANIDALPSQTGQSGKFLTTDGTDASWATPSGGSSYTAGTNINISNDTISTSAAQVVIRRFS